MKYLKVKVAYNEGNDLKFKEYKFPYEENKTLTLPDEYPFSQNIYTGPDTGFNMRYISALENNLLEYCGEFVKLDKDIVKFSPFKDDRFVFYFELVDED
jgi:hypothetical protein